MDKNFKNFWEYRAFGKKLAPMKVIDMNNCKFYLILVLIKLWQLIYMWKTRELMIIVNIFEFSECLKCYLFICTMINIYN